MAQLLSGPFNALQYDPELGSPSLPLGLRQPTRIISDEVVAAKTNGNNGFIAFTLEILDGPNKGAQGLYRLNIYNQSEKAVDIAMRQLSALSIACGKPHWQDTRELYNLPFLMDVVPQKATEANEGKGYTEISQVYDVNGNKPKRGGATGGGNDQSQQQNNQQQQNTQQQQSNNQGNSGGGWNTGANSQSDNSQQQNQNQNQNQQQDPNQNQNGGGNANWNNNQGQGNNQQQQSNANGGGNGNVPPWMQNKG